MEPPRVDSDVDHYHCKAQASPREASPESSKDMEEVTLAYFNAKEAPYDPCYSQTLSELRARMMHELRATYHYGHAA